MRVFRHDSNPAIDQASFRRTARQSAKLIAEGLADAIPGGIQLRAPKNERPDARHFTAGMEDWVVKHSSPLPRNNSLGVRRLLISTLQLDTQRA